MRAKQPARKLPRPKVRPTVSDEEWEALVQRVEKEGTRVLRFQQVPMWAEEPELEDPAFQGIMWYDRHDRPHSITREQYAYSQRG